MRLLVRTWGAGAGGSGAGVWATLAGGSLRSGGGGADSRTGGGGGGGVAMAAFLWQPDIIARAEIPIVNVNIFSFISIPCNPILPNDRTYSMTLEYDGFHIGSSEMGSMIVGDEAHQYVDCHFIGIRRPRTGAAGQSCAREVPGGRGREMPGMPHTEAGGRPVRQGQMAEGRYAECAADRAGQRVA